MNRRDFLKTSSAAAVGAAAVSMSIPTLQAEELTLLGKLIKPIEFQEVYLPEWLAYQYTWSCKWSSDGKTYNQDTNVVRLSEHSWEELGTALRKFYDDDAKDAIKQTIKETKQIG
jgi:hypothetical protein